MFTWTKPLISEHTGEDRSYFAGLRFLENLYTDLDDLYPDTKKIKMMIFSGKVQKTIGTFREYKEENATFDLLKLTQWDHKPILLTDTVDEEFESFTSPSKASDIQISSRPT